VPKDSDSAPKEQNFRAVFFIEAPVLESRATIDLDPVRLAYQPPASSTFLSEQTSRQQANRTFLSEQISNSH
jgi:hypothetical protein